MAIDKRGCFQTIVVIQKALALFRWLGVPVSSFTSEHKLLVHTDDQMHWDIRPTRSSAAACWWMCVTDKAY